MIINIFDEEAYQVILRRINDLKIDSNRQFGKMNVNQMLCHTADQLRVAMGFIEIPLKGNRVSRYFKRAFVLRFNHIPKEKIQTPIEIDQQKGGTKPVGFEDDKVNLIKLLVYLRTKESEYTLKPHPMFGMMNKQQWGKLIYIHLDHHLKQFGV